MRSFNNDELYLLASKMDLPTLLNFCSTSKKINELICKKDEIWQDKLNKEFSDYEIVYMMGYIPPHINANIYRDIYIALYNLKIAMEKFQIKADFYTSLFRVYFDNKNLKSIPKEIENWITLRILDLDHNEITEIKGLDKLINLEILGLNNNKNKKIENIEKLVKLNTLRLSSNQITEIPAIISKLTNLKSLFLYNNPITKISSEIRNWDMIYF
jgi:hypothetical protein